MVTTRTQTHPRPLALFDALFAAGASAASCLVRNCSGAAQLRHVGPCGFTTLHAAILCGRPDLLPSLVLAGAPLNAPLEHAAWEQQAAPLRQLLQQRSVPWVQPPFSYLLSRGCTPLAQAVRIGDVVSVEKLLELGADPNAGSHGITALNSRPIAHIRLGSEHRAMAARLLWHGGDCLAPSDHSNAASDSWLVLLAAAEGRFAELGLADALLARLEVQRGVGELQLGAGGEGEVAGSERAAQLALGAAERGHEALVSHGLAALQAGIDAGAHALHICRALRRILFAAARSGDPAVLRCLLATGLSLDFSSSEGGLPLLGAAACGRDPAAAVPLLHAAGAPLAAEALLCAVDQLAPAGVGALLACGRPAVDTSMRLVHVPGTYTTSFTCPVRRTVSVLQRKLWQEGYPLGMPRDRLEHNALRVLDALLAAGYRATPYSGEDPREMFGHHIKPNFSDRVLFVASGRALEWRPANHSNWPDRFKAAARTVLLAANRGPPNRGRRSSGGGCSSAAAPSSGCLLGSLPPELVQSILGCAATPFSSWL